MAIPTAERKALLAQFKGVPVYIARRWVKRYELTGLLEDLTQAGWLGLCKAADLWDPKRGGFLNYACVLVEQAVREAAKSTVTWHGKAHNKSPWDRAHQVLSWRTGSHAAEGGIDEGGLEQFVPDTASDDPSPFDVVADREAWSKVGSVVGKIEPKNPVYAEQNRAIFWDSLSSGNYAVTGKRFGVSRSLVSEIRRGFIRELRSELTKGAA